MIHDLRIGAEGNMQHKSKKQNLKIFSDQGRNNGTKDVSKKHKKSA